MFAEPGDTLGDTLEFGLRVSPRHAIEIAEEIAMRAISATAMARAIDFSFKNNHVALARVGARQIDKSIWSAGSALFGASPASKTRETDHAQR